MQDSINKEANNKLLVIPINIYRTNLISLSKQLQHFVIKFDKDKCFSLVLFSSREILSRLIVIDPLLWNFCGREEFLVPLWYPSCFIFYVRSFQILYKKLGSLKKPHTDSQNWTSKELNKQDKIVMFLPAFHLRYIRPLFLDFHQESKYSIIWFVMCWQFY